MISLDICKRRALIHGGVATVGLLLLIASGSRLLRDFDVALTHYAIATLVLVFGLIYRYSLWRQRPATSSLYQRGWQALLNKNQLRITWRLWLTKFTDLFLAQRFVFRRGAARWLAHMLIAWGCIGACIITFPLTFGWISFRTPPDHLDVYRVYLVGLPTIQFATGSIVAFLVFHALLICAISVTIGAGIVLMRRLRDHVQHQTIGDDFLPLFMLLSVSLSGIGLSLSAHLMHGYGHEALAVVHAMAVIFTLLWLPYGKLFHIVQRPAQLASAIHREIAEKEGNMKCARCSREFAPDQQITDLMRIEEALGLDYTLKDTAEHYQRICPNCRRAMLGLAQGKLRQCDDGVLQFNWK